MLILGIDPGYGRVGWAVIESKNRKVTLVNAGTIETVGKYKAKKQAKDNVKNKISLEEYNNQTGKDTKETPLVLRIHEIVENLREVFDKYEINQVSVESLFFFKNHKTVMQVSQARGAILQCCLEELGGEYWRIAEYTPLQIKQNLTGAGRAEKSQVGEMVKRILKIKDEEMPRLDDAIDAIAIAMTHASSVRFGK